MMFRKLSLALAALVSIGFLIGAAPAGADTAGGSAVSGTTVQPTTTNAAAGALYVCTMRQTAFWSFVEPAGPTQMGVVGSASCAAPARIGTTETLLYGFQPVTVCQTAFVYFNQPAGTIANSHCGVTFPTGRGGWIGLQQTYITQNGIGTCFADGGCNVPPVAGESINWKTITANQVRISVAFTFVVG